MVTLSNGHTISPPNVDIVSLWLSHCPHNACTVFQVTNPFPTQQLVQQLNHKKEYNATVWARDGEELTFHVKFGNGSHIGVNWTIEEVSPNAGSPSDIVADDCETQDPSSISHNPGTHPSPSKSMILDQTPYIAMLRTARGCRSCPPLVYYRVSLPIVC